MIIRLAYADALRPLSQHTGCQILVPRQHNIVALWSIAREAGTSTVERRLVDEKLMAQRLAAWRSNISTERYSHP